MREGEIPPGDTDPLLTAETTRTPTTPASPAQLEQVNEYGMWHLCVLEGVCYCSTVPIYYCWLHIEPVLKQQAIGLFWVWFALTAPLTRVHVGLSTHRCVVDFYLMRFLFVWVWVCVCVHERLLVGPEPYSFFFLYVLLAHVPISDAERFLWSSHNREHQLIFCFDVQYQMSCALNSSGCLVCVRDSVAEIMKINSIKLILCFREKPQLLLPATITVGLLQRWVFRLAAEGHHKSCEGRLKRSILLSV